MANNQETRISKTDKYKEQFEHSDSEFEIHPGMAEVKVLWEKVDSLIQKLNSIDTEQHAKTGITTAQADAITANTAKVGITTAQASAITANTAKTGITTTQATQLTNLNAGRASKVGTNIKSVTAQITQAVNVDSKTGTATIETTVLLSNGNRYTMSETLTKVNKK